MDTRIGGGRHAPEGTACDVCQGHDDGFAQARAIHGRFYAGYKPGVGLDVVAEMGAADDPLWTLAEGTADDVEGIGVGSGPRNIVFTPGVTDLPAEIDT